MPREIIWARVNSSKQVTAACSHALTLRLMCHMHARTTMLISICPKLPTLQFELILDISKLLDASQHETNPFVLLDQRTHVFCHQARQRSVFSLWCDWCRFLFRGYSRADPGIFSWSWSGRNDYSGIYTPCPSVHQVHVDSGHSRLMQEWLTTLSK